MRPREHSHRLPPEDYEGDVTVAFTACIEDRHRVLAEAKMVSRLLPMLEEAVTQFACKVPIYCFMPDHLHVLVKGVNEGSRPKLAMDRFKHASAMFFYRRNAGFDGKRISMTSL